MKSKYIGELSWVSIKEIDQDKASHSPGHCGLSLFFRFQQQ